MKHRFVLALTTLALLAVPMAGHAKGGEDAPLPKKLDSLYPPKAPQPLWLFQMLSLANAFEGIVADLEQGDVAGAKANYEKLTKIYGETSKMVPEWRSKFPQKPLTDLGKALGTGDQGKIMGAFQKLGEVCTSCHMVNMPKANFRYSWPKFDAIKVEDPVTKQELDFIRLMQVVGTSFTGIANDLEQGQPDGAMKHLANFKARFGAMKESCEGCHDSKRTYFVDEEIEKLIAGLEAGLKAKNPKAAGEAAQAIGMKSCRGCHLVHVPAAMYHLRTADGKAH